jgi:hypothetical protein
MWHLALAEALTRNAASTVRANYDGKHHKPMLVGKPERSADRRRFGHSISSRLSLLIVRDVREPPLYSIAEIYEGSDRRNISKGELCHRDRAPPRKGHCAFLLCFGLE